MNRALLDPFQSTSLPETIEEFLERGVTKCVAFNRRGTILAAGCLNGEVVLWDFDTRGVLRTFTGHKAAVTAVSWTRNGRQLITASQSGQILLFDVLRVTVQSHPTDSSLALASCASGAPLLVKLATGATRPLPLFAPGMGDDAPTGGTRRGAQDALGGQAVFSKAGDFAFVGTTKGWLLMVELATFAVVDGLKSPGASAAKSLTLGKGGSVLLVNAADRTIRAFDVATGGPVAGEKPIRFARDFQNAVSKVQWSAAALSADADWVIGSSGGSGEHLLYVWDRQHGALEKILEGPQTASVSQVAWHPRRPVLAAVSGDGRVYLWARVFTENWSAFAPDFKELDENEEYIEREDEFDAEAPAAGGDAPASAKPAAVEEEADVDVETVDPALADSDDEDVPDALHYLPLAPERDERFARKPTPPPAPKTDVPAAADAAGASLIEGDILGHEGDIPIGTMLADPAADMLVSMDVDDTDPGKRLLDADAAEDALAGAKRLRSGSTR